MENSRVPRTSMRMDRSNVTGGAVGTEVDPAKQEVFASHLAVLLPTQTQTLEEHTADKHREEHHFRFESK